MNYALGLLLAFTLGAACRWLDIPQPAPPTIFGVMIILASTIGYIVVDHFVK